MNPFAWVYTDHEYVVTLEQGRAIIAEGKEKGRIVYSPRIEDAQGNVQPIRRLYACTFGRGARETAQSITSWLAR